MIIEKIKKSINKFCEKRAVAIVVTGVIAAMYVLFGVTYFLKPMPVLLHSTPAGHFAHFGPILYSNTVVQEVSFGKDVAISNIELQLGTFSDVRHNINQVFIYLNDVLTREIVLDSRVVVDNAFHQLPALDMHIPEGDIMRIVITSRDGDSSEAISIWTTPSVVSENGLSRHNLYEGTYEGLTGEINMRIYSMEYISLLRGLSERYIDTSIFRIFIVFGIIMALTITSLFLMIKDDNKSLSDEELQGGDK